MPRAPAPEYHMTVMKRAVVVAVVAVVATVYASTHRPTALAYGAGASVSGLPGVAETFAGWRSAVGHGRRVTSARRTRLLHIADKAVRPTHAGVLQQQIIAGTNGPAIYLDLASRKPVWTLRHAYRLVSLLARQPFSGGWAIRLRNQRHKTVWIAGHAGNGGFVGSATPAIDAASPVKHG
jgi:hypothetical protein